MQCSFLILNTLLKHFHYNPRHRWTQRRVSEWVGGLGEQRGVFTSFKERCWNRQQGTIAFQTVHKRNAVFPPFPTCSVQHYLQLATSALLSHAISCQQHAWVNRIQAFPSKVNCKLFYIGIVLCSVTNAVLLYFLSCLHMCRETWW